LRVRRLKLALYCSLVPQDCWVSLEVTERVRVVGPWRAVKDPRLPGRRKRRFPGHATRDFTMSSAFGKRQLEPAG
jgi:hypothetical protein